MNKRRCKRNRFLALAKVKDLLTNTNLGYIADISTGGMMLLSPRSPGHPDHRRVSITLPRRNADPVTVTGEIRIAWHKNGQQPGNISTGCQFVNFDVSEKHTLLKAARDFILPTH